MMLSIGFTGTRYGMSPQQHLAVGRIAVEVLYSSTHPRSDRDDVAKFLVNIGDCIGADGEFFDIMRPFRGSWLVGHPGPLNDAERQAGRDYDERRPHSPHMKRNQAIVDESNVMIATPFEMAEQHHGGTWRTIGFARKAGRPLAIVDRNGGVAFERWEKR